MNDYRGIVAYFVFCFGIEVTFSVLAVLKFVALAFTWIGEYKAVSVEENNISKSEIPQATTLTIRKLKSEERTPDKNKEIDLEKGLNLSHEIE